MKRIEIGASSGRKIRAELADSPLKQFWGLSLRSEGKMLFDFGREVHTFIDMMLLSEPLHLYFLDSEKRVFEIQKAKPWSLDPRSWKLYRPDKPYRYLLESFEPLEIEEGQKLEFEV